VEVSKRPQLSAGATKGWWGSVFLVYRAKERKGGTRIGLDWLGSEL
jgi:hypothetical protein